MGGQDDKSAGSATSGGELEVGKCGGLLSGGVMGTGSLVSECPSVKSISGQITTGATTATYTGDLVDGQIKRGIVGRTRLVMRQRVECRGGGGGRISDT